MNPPLLPKPRVPPVVFRLIELTSILVFFVYVVMLVQALIMWALATTVTWWHVVVSVLLLPVSYVAADFVSGFVHFLADNFGSEKTFFWGEKFIRPFREHHVDPKAITRHGFLETNGDNSLVSLLVLIPIFHFVYPTTPARFFIGVFVVFFLLAIFLTNQLHSWAHADKPPRVVVWLQKRRLVLSPEVHSVHHTAPFATYYCITSGWLNPTLAKYGIFERRPKV